MDIKKIINPWKEVPEYDCFGCSPDNPIGLQMTFTEEGDEIVSRWKPSRHYQSWVNTMHGGILTALCDEAGGWIVMRRMKTTGMTTRLEMRYRKAVRTTDKLLTIRARMTDSNRRLATVHVDLFNEAGELCVECDATYYLFPADKAHDMGFKPLVAEDE